MFKVSLGFSDLAASGLRGQDETPDPALESEEVKLVFFFCSFRFSIKSDSLTKNPVAKGLACWTGLVEMPRDAWRPKGMNGSKALWDLMQVVVSVL